MRRESFYTIKQKIDKNKKKIKKSENFIFD